MNIALASCAERMLRFLTDNSKLATNETPFFITTFLV